MPHNEAINIREKVAFCQAIKSRLAKFDSTGLNKTDEEMETAIRQVIDGALVSSKVVDIFDAAGIKKPELSILSEEFLLEIKGMEHKNLALEVLRKLLNDEIKARARKNLVQSKKLMELLEESIKRYHNKIISAAEVVDKLIDLANDMKAMDRESSEIGLTDYEYAFYTAVSDNKSAKELMEKETLRKLAQVLFHKVKSNTTIDWTLKESVKANLKVIVKRTLRKYGYPPDMEKLATDLVLKQAELIAADIISQ
jgi:type I restriction enzyme R subunit